MASSTEDKVKQIIVEQLGVDEAEVTPTASFIDDLGADSLDTVELVMALEEGFGIEIPDEDAEKITTVKDALTYIEAHLPEVLVSIEVAILEKRRVVVTGVGLVTALGTGTEETWKGLCEGRSGVGPITRFDTSAVFHADRRRG